MVADALSRRHALLTHLDSRVLGFTYIQKLYEQNHEFGEVYKNCRDEGLRKSIICLKDSSSERTKCASLDVLLGFY